MNEQERMRRKIEIKRRALIMNICLVVTKIAPPGDPVLSLHGMAQVRLFGHELKDECTRLVSRIYGVNESTRDDLASEAVVQLSQHALSGKMHSITPTYIRNQLLNRLKALTNRLKGHVKILVTEPQARGSQAGSYWEVLLRPPFDFDPMSAWVIEQFYIRNKSLNSIAKMAANWNGEEKSQFNPDGLSCEIEALGKILRNASTDIAEPSPLYSTTTVTTPLYSNEADLLLGPPFNLKPLLAWTLWMRSNGIDFSQMVDLTKNWQAAEAKKWNPDTSECKKSTLASICEQATKITIEAVLESIDPQAAGGRNKLFLKCYLNDGMTYQEIQSRLSVSVGSCANYFQKASQETAKRTRCKLADVEATSLQISDLMKGIHKLSKRRSEKYQVIPASTEPENFVELTRDEIIERLTGHPSFNCKTKNLVKGISKGRAIEVWEEAIKSVEEAGDHEISGWWEQLYPVAMPIEFAHAQTPKSPVAEQFLLLHSAYAQMQDKHWKPTRKKLSQNIAGRERRKDSSTNESRGSLREPTLDRGAIHDNGDDRHDRHDDHDGPTDE